MKQWGPQNHPKWNGQWEPHFPETPKGVSENGRNPMYCNVHVMMINRWVLAITNFKETHSVHGLSPGNGFDQTLPIEEHQTLGT